MWYVCDIQYAVLYGHVRCCIVFSLLKQFTLYLGVLVILLLNVMDLLRVA